MLTQLIVVLRFWTDNTKAVKLKHSHTCTQPFELKRRMGESRSNKRQKCRDMAVFWMNHLLILFYALKEQTVWIFHNFRATPRDVCWAKTRIVKQKQSKIEDTKWPELCWSGAGRGANTKSVWKKKGRKSRKAIKGGTFEKEKEKFPENFGKRWRRHKQDDANELTSQRFNGNLRKTNEEFDFVWKRS